MNLSHKYHIKMVAAPFLINLEKVDAILYYLVESLPLLRDLLNITLHFVKEINSCFCFCGFERGKHIQDKQMLWSLFFFFFSFFFSLNLIEKITPTNPKNQFKNQFTRYLQGCITLLFTYSLNYVSSQFLHHNFYNTIAGKENNYQQILKTCES